MSFFPHLPTPMVSSFPQTDAYLVLVWLPRLNILFWIFWVCFLWKSTSLSTQHLTSSVIILTLFYCFRCPWGVEVWLIWPSLTSWVWCLASHHLQWLNLKILARVLDHSKQMLSHYLLLRFWVILFWVYFLLRSRLSFLIFNDKWY